MVIITIIATMATVTIMRQFILHMVMPKMEPIIHQTDIIMVQDIIRDVTMVMIITAITIIIVIENFLIVE
uniref:NADH dehydrogenase subunit 5 n=1 Tax=Panagrolaimus sp. JU765 TaxID=591449 RepID=A0AC34RLG2_9BILA